MVHPKLPALLAVPCLLAAQQGVPVIPTSPSEVAYRDRVEVKAFMEALKQRYGLDPGVVAGWLGNLKPDPEVVALAAPPLAPTKKNWRKYRAGFVHRSRVKPGVTFWRTHMQALGRAEAQYGVPPEIIVAILGVETIYGRATGRFPVLSTLLTLAFDHPETPTRPRRQAMFLNELEAFLVECNRAKRDPREARGSYAGAMGIPQFLPTSLRDHAVDFDGDGVIDVRSSAVDAIGSVARFLKNHGWEPGRPVVWGLKPGKKVLAAIQQKADGDAEPKWVMGSLLEAGIVPNVARNLKQFQAKEGKTQVVLVDLPTPDAPTEYCLGLRNFYVITRYNRSFFYAMAVYDLSRALKAAMAKPAR